MMRVSLQASPTVGTVSSANSRKDPAFRVLRPRPPCVYVFFRAYNSGSIKCCKTKQRRSLVQHVVGAHNLWVLKGRGSKGEGYLRQLGEPRGALGKTREYWGVLSYLRPLDPPPLRVPSIMWVHGLKMLEGLGDFPWAGKGGYTMQKEYEGRMTRLFEGSVSGVGCFMVYGVGN